MNSIDSYMFITTIFSTIMANQLLNYELNVCWSSCPWIKGLKLKADAGNLRSCEYVNYHLHSNHKTSIFGFNERPYACNCYIMHVLINLNKDLQASHPYGGKSPIFKDMICTIICIMLNYLCA
jgi:hypothetical protein